jgi:hypothetical protein
MKGSGTITVQATLSWPFRAVLDWVRFKIFMMSDYSRPRFKKRTSINSISIFHKEKEMADFRKWLLAFAVVALLLGMGTSAYAQNTPASHVRRTLAGRASSMSKVSLDGWWWL